MPGLSSLPKTLVDCPFAISRLCGNSPDSSSKDTGAGRRSVDPDDSDSPEVDTAVAPAASDSDLASNEDAVSCVAAPVARPASDSGCASDTGSGGCVDSLEPGIFFFFL